MELDKHEMFVDLGVPGRALAMAFSPCLSRKRANFDPSLRACDGLFVLSVDEKANLCSG